MRITDSIYGTFEIDEPVLIELIKSAPVQRLKGIEQVGIFDTWPFPRFNRYEHEIGVMLLLRKLGVGIEEQIAGLLHDVSHTAFSHVIDTVLCNADEDYHDKVRAAVIERSEIPEILERHGFDTGSVDADSFPLIKAEAPNLSVDRFDYALREFRLWANPSIVKSCVASLTVRDGKLVFTSKQTADAFARTLLRLQTEHWGGAQSCIRYHIFAKALKLAMNDNEITLDDFSKDDEHILKKLRASKNPHVHAALKRLAEKHVEVDMSQPVFKHVKKFRYVDPEYIDGKKVKRLSATDASFRAFLDEHMRINEKGVLLNTI